MKRLAGLAATAALLASLTGACSSDSSDDESPATDSDDNAELVATLLDNPESEGISDDQAECFVETMIDELGLEQTQAFVDDPDAWAGDQVEAAIEAGDTDAPPAIDALGDAFTSCGIDTGMDDVDLDVDETVPE